MAQKILLQINCKLGGELWGVDIPLVSGAEISFVLRTQDHSKKWLPGWWAFLTSDVTVV